MARIVKLAILVLAAMTVAPAAHAQTPLDGSAYAFPVPDYVGALVGANSLGSVTGGGGSKHRERDRERRRERARENRQAKRPTARQRATLRFAPTPAVTQRVDQRVIDQAGTSVDAATLHAQLGAARLQFREVLGRVGWSARDLGDMAAFAFVQGYLVWHGDPRLSQAGLRRLRRDIRDNLAAQAPVRRLSDARQQEIAEILEMRVILFLDARNDARISGDSARVAIVRADMRDWTASIFDVDVADVRLTRRGLVER